MTRAFVVFKLLLLGFALSACRGEGLEPQICDPDGEPGDLVINELVAKNGGVWIDKTGATDDFVELVNVSERSLRTSQYALGDRSGDFRLPDVFLLPGERVLIWTDDDPSQGASHLPFRLSAEGETVRVTSCEKVIDAVHFPALKENDAYARHPDGAGEFGVCRYATPDADNGPVCAAPVPPGLPADDPFAPYEWPDAHPEIPTPLLLSELSLAPAGFIEVENTSDDSVDLSEYSLEIAAIRPGIPFPAFGEGTSIALGGSEIASGQRVSVAVSEDDVASLTASPDFEGVVTLYQDGEVIDRVDFMRWPVGAVLARPEAEKARFVFLEEATPGEPNEGDILASRDVGNRVRGLRTLGDFEALAEGSNTLGTSAVKFVVDVDQGDAVHFLRAADWALHYTFIREVIDGEEPLDRCDPADNDLFNQGWYEFSVAEYFSTVGRHYYLGTLVEHGATGHHTTEHALGDEILPEDIRRAFFVATGRVLEPENWAFRPQDDEQTARARVIEGTLPVLEKNAPFADLKYQPLTHGTGYGVLTFVPAAELHSTALGAQVLLVTDDVPNDIPLVGGLITQAFQTPLAHVNVLSQNRGTPNMALRDATTDPRITDFLGTLVRLTVTGSDFSIEPATAEEAAEFWDSFSGGGPLVAPRLDLEPRALVSLDEASLGDLPVIGAKAAQLAELLRVRPVTDGICSGAPDFSVPGRAFAVPVVHFREHFERSGAEQLLLEVSAEEEFGADPLHRAEALSQVQALILEEEVDSELLAEVTNEVERRYGYEPLRLRSSSNAEDLPGFNGAGLYTSASAALGDPENSLETGLKTVWASLFNPRAYDERELANVDHSQVAMGVLIHEAFPNEAANGVGVSRNILDPIRGDIYFLNSQAGEAAVTNPAPGVGTEAVEFQWPPRTPLLTYQSQSSLLRGENVMSESEMVGVACALRAIHDHFAPLLDPEQEDPWFAMEIEYKLLYPSRQLVVKQARSHAFSGFDVATDCREF